LHAPLVLFAQSLFWSFLWYRPKQSLAQHPLNPSFPVPVITAVFGTAGHICAAVYHTEGLTPVAPPRIRVFHWGLEDLVRSVSGTILNGLIIHTSAACYLPIIWAFRLGLWSINIVTLALVVLGMCLLASFAHLMAAVLICCARTVAAVAASLLRMLLPVQVRSRLRCWGHCIGAPLRVWQCGV